MNFYDLVPNGERAVRLDISDLRYVAARMRQKDAEEIYQGSGLRDPEAIAVAIAKDALFGYSILDAQRDPQACVSIHQRIPGVWEVGMFATDQWENVFTSVSKYTRLFVKHAVQSNIVRRVEARSLASYTESHEWLKWLGARYECTLPDWGVDRTDFIQLAWRLSDYRPKNIGDER